MDWKKDPDQALKVADIIREIVDEYRSDVHGQTVDLVCGWFEDYAERLSPGETWPKWFVSPNFSVRPDDGWSAFWKWDSPDPSEAEYCLVDGTLGKGSPTSFGWEKEYQIKVTEAEAKAHVRPEPPKGKKLTGEFRVPNRGETYVRVDGGTSGIRCLENEHPADSLVSFNGDKRWLTIDDNTCPTCHGKGTV